jgi:preprotein translocase subunit SecG
MGILTAVIVVLHVLVSLALIALILLHSGRGGGLSDVFGGGMGGSLGGSTIAERNLDRLTVIVALVFAVTTVALTWLLS